MPSDPKVWVVLIVAATIVVGLVVWFGGRFKFRGHGIAVDVEPPPGENKITIAKQAELRNVEAGDIAGVKTEGSGGASGSTSNIDVLSGGKIHGGTIGDIVGIKQTPKTAPGTKKEDNDRRK